MCPGSTLSLRSRTPPMKSSTSPVKGSKKMALMVKSRRPEQRRERRRVTLVRTLNNKEAGALDT